MARRIANSVLNASTIDILNVIRQNASYEYQSQVPVVSQETDIPKVGEVLYGTPSLANTFLNALMNRIALVRVNSATFNNHFAELKKGKLEFGETIEEVFVGIAKAREFSAEKAEAREFKRTIPDVRSAFHVINYKVQYPITIQDIDLRQAFLSMDGVQDLIAKVVNSVYTAAEYDEYLLFKYLLIKSIAGGVTYPKAMDITTDFDNAAIEFRAMSNQLTFMSNLYNNAGVTTATPKSDQYIFMDSQFNARFDVKTLASAFNMDKADFVGRLKLIDDWTSFDNGRFDQIRAESTGLEEVTQGELALLSDVKAVLVDKEFFQVYDNVSNMTEKYVASGMYWNYFYNVWKTVSYSPFSNIVTFVNNAITLPESLTVTVVSRDDSSIDNVTVLNLDVSLPTGAAITTITNMGYKFKQTEQAVQASIAIQPYGTVIFSNTDAETMPAVTGLTLTIGNNTYRASDALSANAAVGSTLSLTLVAD